MLHGRHSRRAPSASKLEQEPPPCRCLVAPGRRACTAPCTVHARPGPRSRSGNEATTASPIGPHLVVRGRRRSGLGPGDSVHDPGRNPFVAVDVTAGRGHEQYPAAAGFAVLSEVDKVAQAVGDERLAEMTGAEDPMGMAADDDVRAGGDQSLGQVVLLRRSAVGRLDAPMKEDHQGVDVRARRADSGEQPVGVDAERQALAGCRSQSIATPAPARASPSPRRWRSAGRRSSSVRPEGLGGVVADAQHGHPGSRDGVKSVGHSDRAVVQGVVVRHADDVHSGRFQSLK